MEREAVLQCEVLGGLETFERVSRSEAGKSTLQGQIHFRIIGPEEEEWR